MSDDWEQDEIDAQYEIILNKCKGGRLYTMPIDVRDMKQVAVAAYLIGQSEVRVQHMKDWETIRGLR